MRSIHRPKVAAISVIAVVLLIATGCSAPQSASEPPPPITLTLGTEDVNGDVPSSLQLMHFVDEVAALSDGAITIEPVFKAATGDDPDSEPKLADMVIDGGLDLGLVATRVWDLKGVNSLQALNAPFLVTSDELVHTVIASDALRDELLSGLPDIGVRGIDLFPEALRHPFGFNGALGGVEDYAGKVMRVPDSAAVAAIFESFGATTDGGLADSATQVGAESAYEFTPGGTATGNVTFTAKINALVANDEVYQSLTEDQRSLLAQAAVATREWASEGYQTDAEAAATFCNEGGLIEAATPEQVEGLEKAAATVTDSLSEDELTKSIIDEIAALKAELGPQPAPVVTCDGLVAAPDAAASTLNGVYEVTISQDEYRAAGEKDEVEIPKNSGLWTWTFEDGRARFTQVDTATGYTDAGSGLSYTLEGNHFTLYWTHESQDWTSADVAVQPDGSLVFTNIKDGWPDLQIISEVLFGSKPWVKVGEP